MPANQNEVKPSKEVSLTPVVTGLMVMMMVMMMPLFLGMGQPQPPPGLPYCCFYCSQCFATFDELVAHVQSQHPGERLPILIIWT